MAVPPNRNVFITGCNRGLGLEFVKQFLRLQNPPDHLFATCRSLAAESALELKGLASKNPNLKILELEVTDDKAIERCAKEVNEIIGSKALHILINNAGFAKRTSLNDVTRESMKEHYETNTIAPLMIVKAFRSLLQKAVAGKHEDKTKFPRALVVNISSRVGSIGKTDSGGMYPYRASKAALNMINKCLSVDLKDYGITTVVLNPGWVRTDMGGPKAVTATEYSVKCMIERIAEMDESKAGNFYHFEGEIFPW